jgi:hypothetical protein
MPPRLDRSSIPILSTRGGAFGAIKNIPNWKNQFAKYEN